VKQFLLFIIFIGSFCLLNACGSSSPPPPPPPPVADFSVVITPTSVSTIVGGTSAPVTVTLNTVNGFTSVVSVTISGFPNGINSLPASPFTLTAGMSRQITFSAPAAAGTFTVEFQGASGTLSHSGNATLTVTLQPNPYLVSASYYPVVSAERL
jgi:hypothetical protein